MGERCYAEIRVRKCDKAKWEALDYHSEHEEAEDDDDDVVVLIDQEREYGIKFSDDDLVPGCPMIGWHDAKVGCYDSMMVAWDGEVLKAHLRSPGGLPSIECGFNGPSVADVTKAQDFLSFSEHVEMLLLNVNGVAWSATERGNTLLRDGDGGIAAWLQFDDDRKLEVTYSPNNYPSLTASLKYLSDSLLAAHINKNLQSWIVGKSNCPGVDIDEDGRVRYREDDGENEEPENA